MDPKYQNVGNIFDKTIEECAELIHIISKIKRFGVDNFHPKTKVNNRDQLNLEITDLRKRLDELQKEVENNKEI